VKHTLIRILLFIATIAAIAVIGYNTGRGQQVETVFLSIGLLVMSLTILVTLHEFGHFLPARLFGMRVDKFYLFFDFLFPIPTLLNFALFKKKVGDTEYGIGWFPMGGYVQIAGMIDESLDTEHLKNEPQPWEFRSKPVWQRFIVMVGGVTVNVILGVLIFTGIKYATGEEHLPMSQVKYGISVEPHTVGALLGFRTGDELVSFKGKAFPYFDDYTDLNLLLEDGAYFEVRRQNQVVRLAPPTGVLDELSNDSLQKSFFIPEMPAFVTVAPKFPAEMAGVKTGDLVLRVDSVAVSTFSQVRAQLKGKANKMVHLVVSRDGQEIPFDVAMNADAKMGVGPNLDKSFKIETTDYNLGQAFIEGSKAAFGVISTNAKGFRKIGSGEASVSKSIQGPVEIAALFADAFRARGWISFWTLTGMLSMVLAFVNILPIPALDGGHAMFLLYEGITGREPSEKVRLIAQQIGMVLVLGLMVFVLAKGFLGLF